MFNLWFLRFSVSDKLDLLLTKLNFNCARTPGICTPIFQTKIVEDVDDSRSSNYSARARASNLKDNR